MQRDAMFYVALNVGVRHKGCKQFEVTHTAFLGFERSADPKPPWHEVWTVVACGTARHVPITFSPDATGTNISVPVAGPVAE